jgi:hypothetical protein
MTRLACFMFLILCISALAQHGSPSLTCDEIRLYDEAVANANRNVNKDNGMAMFDYQEQYHHEMDAAEEKWKQCSGWPQ